jgi:hypothetical protein
MTGQNFYARARSARNRSRATSQLSPGSACFSTYARVSDGLLTTFETKESDPFLFFLFQKTALLRLIGRSVLTWILY